MSRVMSTNPSHCVRCGRRFNLALRRVYTPLSLKGNYHYSVPSLSSFPSLSLFLSCFFYISIAFTFVDHSLRIQHRCRHCLGCVCAECSTTKVRTPLHNNWTTYFVCVLRVLCVLTIQAVGFETPLKRVCVPCWELLSGSWLIRPPDVIAVSFVFGLLCWCVSCRVTAKWEVFFMRAEGLPFAVHLTNNRWEFLSSISAALSRFGFVVTFSFFLSPSTSVTLSLPLFLSSFSYFSLSFLVLFSRTLAMSVEQLAWQRLRRLRIICRTSINLKTCRGTKVLHCHSRNVYVCA